ncbi:MAG: sugar kinase [Planctomycetes bacterium]|nr:sugar kinase [Planctomycetota bacterium]
MPLLALGTVAFDTIHTARGRAERVIGGSATHFSYAASFFSPVKVVSVIGDDFPDDYLRLLADRGVDVTGVERARGQTFFWAGEYNADFSRRTTLEVHLNVFGAWQPRVVAAHRAAPFVFLGNGHPDLQARVLAQMQRPKFVCLDSMNHWIVEERDGLLEVLKKVDAFILNDEEARLLTEESNLIRAGRALLALGPRMIILKKGEHGALLFADGLFFALPAYPVENVVDPTGAGDAFAGGVMGFLARANDVSFPTVKRALLRGAVIASFIVEDFSLHRLKTVRPADIEDRVRRMEEMLCL